MEDKPLPIATKTSWKTLPHPATRTDLGFKESYTPEEFGCMTRGLIPIVMEDKWFVYFEEPWLYFHRSWTGACIYALRFESSKTSSLVVESWVNRDTSQYRETRAHYDRALVKFLVDALLLGKKATFPVPDNIPADTPKGVYQHSLVGRGYPENTISMKPTDSSFWKRILKFFYKKPSA